MAEPTPGARYRLESVIGSGVTGTVWRAVDPTGSRVAVKLLEKPWGNSLAVRDAFAAQRPALTAISSPHLVRLRDLAIDNPLGVVSDFVDGEDLRTRLGRGRLDARSTALLGAAVAQGLQTLHERGQLQADLRCENILLPDGDPSRARLTGFGLQPLLAASGTIPERVAPNPAPELADGGEPTSATDIHALGVVLYEAVNGPQSSWEPSVPEPLRTLILSLVAPAPGDRPNAAVTAMSFAELAEQLDAAPAVSATAAHTAGLAPGRTAVQPGIAPVVAQTAVQPAVPAAPVAGAAPGDEPGTQAGWVDEHGFGDGAHAAPGSPRKGFGKVIALGLVLAAVAGGGDWALTRGGDEPTASRTVTAYATPSTTASSAAPAPVAPAPSQIPASTVPAAPSPTVTHLPVQLNPEAKLCQGALQTGDVPYVNVAVGNSATTTCKFAVVVAQKYREAKATGGQITFDATSPSTHKTYTMTCSGSPMVSCTGGNDAVVLIW